MLDLIPEIKDTEPIVREFVQNCPPAPIVIFTGAGASQPLGFPVTRDFFRNLVEWDDQGRLQPRGEHWTESTFPLLRTLLASIFRDECKTKECTFDVEEVIQLVEWLRTHTAPGNPRFLQAYDAVRVFLAHGGAASVDNVAGHQSQRTGTMDSLRLRELLVALSEQLKDAVFENYRNPGNLDHDALTLYEPLFKTLAPILHKHDRFSIPIFTTNYDRSIEEILEPARGQGMIARAMDVRRMAFIDGFRPDDERPREFVWQAGFYSQQLAEAEETKVVIPYCKLHGSLGWRRRIADEWIIRTSVEDRPTSAPDREVLIYPGEKHQPRDEPFASMYAMLRHFLSKADIVLVIGFLLRDEPLYNAFATALRDGTRFLFMDPGHLSREVESLGKEQPKEHIVHHWQEAFGPDTDCVQLGSLLADPDGWTSSLP